jgi:hypothetical protein
MFIVLLLGGSYDEYEYEGLGVFWSKTKFTSTVASKSVTLPLYEAFKEGPKKVKEDDLVKAWIGNLYSY